MSALLLLLAGSLPAAPAPPPRPIVELVFCVDTTASMPAILDALKKAYRPMVSAIRRGQPAPILRVGVVAYRDRGDEYVTRVFDLSDDLDTVEKNLGALTADGGGDVPESVNAALRDCVRKIKWNEGPRTLRLIVLLGDAPPHMDYKGEVRYPATCKKARAKGILIHALQCGSDPDCARHWKEIARLGGGDFVPTIKPDDLAEILLGVLRRQAGR